MRRTRLDILLVARGLFESRSRAAAAIMAGDVVVGEPRVLADKPGQLVAPDVSVAVAPGRPYVSRGGVKLANALDRLGIDPAGRRCLDVGASTGGFTDCLLRRGADHVVAVDVGYGQLDWALRTSEQVTVLERVNARTLDCAALPYRPDLVVVDVSFISLTKVLPAVLRCAAEPFECLALVKPQFEVGREHVGKGGVVRDPDQRHAAMVSVGEAVGSLGYGVAGYVSSGLAGPAGNRESFVWIRPGAGERAPLDLDAMAAAVES